MESRANKRQDFRALGVVFAQMFGGFADLALARQKYQDVAAAQTRQIVHGIDDGFLDLLLALVFLGFLQRAVAHLHRVHAPGHLDHRRIVEMPGEALGVDGGRSHDHLQVGPLRQQLLQVAQQKVDVEAALVRFVDDDGVVGVEETVALGFRQQNAVRHQFEVARFRQLVVETHLVTHRLAQRRFQLLRDTRRHGTRGDAARLGVADQPADAAPSSRQIFGNWVVLPEPVSPQTITT